MKKKILTAISGLGFCVSEKDCYKYVRIVE